MSSASDGRKAALQMVVSLAMVGVAAVPPEEQERTAVTLVHALYLLGVSVDELAEARATYALAVQALT